MTCDWLYRFVRLICVQKRKKDSEPHDLPLRVVTDQDFNSQEVVLILIYTKQDMIASLKRSRIRYFLRNVAKSGLTVDSVQCLSNDHLVFVKISAVPEVLYKYAPSLGIPLHCDNPFFREKQMQARYMKTVFAVESDRSVEFRNISQSLGNIKLREITESEKLQIIYQILKFVKYGFADDEVGVNRLLGQGTLQTLYPTHERDGGDPGNMVSDKRLLNDFWASWTVFFKKQPTFLIQKYFGAEVGFYFAYLNHYVKMLVPAALLGVLTMIYGIVSLFTENNFKSDEVCSSKMILCPSCYKDTCNYIFLNYSCYESHFNHMIDNQTTVIYGILISIWSTISFELWKREQSSLTYQWNVYAAHVNMTIRPQYENSATLRKLSPVTGEWEPYEDTALRIFHCGVSILTIIITCVLSVAAIVGSSINFNIMSRAFALSNMDYANQAQITGDMVMSSLINVSLMMIFDYICRYLSIWLVNFENPRTEQELENSYILKIYLFTFINSFGAALYIAFFKGRFKSYPGRENTNYFFGDQCDPTGCAENLYVHVLVVLTVKFIAKDIFHLVLIYLRTSWRRYVIREFHGKMPNYEEQYYMKQPNRFFLINEYKDIAIQYGYITFFSSAQPLAPLIILIHTLIEIRMGAIRIMRNYRRPIPICTSGLGAWMQVFMAMTHLGVVTNALVIGWTMSFIPTTIYKYGDREKPYYEKRFAIFDTNDYSSSAREQLSSIAEHPPTCRFTSMRYPPDHPKEYEFDGAFWHEVTWIMAFIIIFEHVVLAITSIISYAIPDIPAAVKQMMEYENLKLVKENYQKIGENVEEQPDPPY